MSINSAMQAGVTGLISNSSALAAISDNIANANTVGYKRVGIDFSTLVTNDGLVSRYTAGGVSTTARQFVDQQGTIQSSTNATDLAIAGDGFFVTTSSPTGATPGDARYFTRAGAFSPDKEGNLKNSAGLYLQGWPADANGDVTVDSANLSSLQTINILDVASTAEPTTNGSIVANLNSDQTVNAQAATYTAGDMNLYARDPTAAGAIKPDFSMQVPVADSKGGQRILVYDFLKTDNANEWKVEVRADPASDLADPTQPIAHGTVTFKSDGSFSSAAGDSTAGDQDLSQKINVPWKKSLGIDDSTVTVDLSKISQLSSASSVSSVTTNGTAFGTLAGVSIDDKGLVTAVYQNGSTRRLAQLAIATFPNSDGLRPADGNAYRASAASGSFTLKAAGTAGAGSVSPSSLESSTVDLSSEFTGLITTQRAYSASSKIITTADQMLQELLDIKR
jgi:flagellar hook protein FlgE